MDIELMEINGKWTGFIWSIKDALRTRKDARVLGQWCGTLPLFPQQNRFFGIPLQLMPEEILHLVDAKVARVILPTSARGTENSVVFYQGLFQDMIDRWDNHQKKRKLQHPQYQCDNTSNDNLNVAERLIPTDLSPLPFGANEWQSVMIKNKSEYALPETLTIRHRVSNQENNRDEADDASEVLNLIRKTHARRYKIFEFLHRINEWVHIGSGHRYGGLYSLYAGDPMFYHSIGVIYPISGARQKKQSDKLNEDEESFASIAPVRSYDDLIRCGRLASSTAKKAIFTWVHDQDVSETEEVKCWTVEWAGF